MSAIVLKISVLSMEGGGTGNICLCFLVLFSPQCLFKTTLTAAPLWFGNFHFFFMMGKTI